MKVADKVILILNGGDALATAISDGLNPNPNSRSITLTDAFVFPLVNYGIKDRNASGKIVHFINLNGHYEATILLLQCYEPPILACALNEVLLRLAGDGSSTMPTLIAPFIVPESKLKQEHNYSLKKDEVSVYSIKLGSNTDVTEALSSRVQKAPPFSQVNHEDLAMLLDLVNVIKISTVVLIGLSDQGVSNKNSKEELEIICEIGELLASVFSLSFSKETMVQNPTKISRDGEEAWRALYG